MLLRIPNVLSADQVAQARQLLEQAEWVDGKVTAGFQSAKVKNNEQIPEDHPVSRKIGDVILGALEQNPLFMSAALPRRVFPPLFNCYREGRSFGAHVDNAVRQLKGTAFRIRTDLSATLFLSAPEEYDGGELVVQDTYGEHSVKLPAGHMVLYPSGSLHRVNVIARGTRIASFFWVESMVRSDEDRGLLFELDNTIQSIVRERPDDAAATRLTNVYHNLLRRWGDV